MKNLKNSLIALVLTTMLTSCYSVKMSALSPGVQLAQKGESLPIKEKKKNWYILWGLIPLSNETTGKVIEENKFDKVRIETKMTFGDFVISAFTGWLSVVSTTTIVEGVQTPVPAPAVSTTPKRQ